MSATDRELVERFKDRGDEEAFRILFRRHTPRVYAVALRLAGGRHAEAEDVVQETWFRAAQRVDRFEWRSSLATWLVGIAVNCAREAMRARLDADDLADVAEIPGPAPARGGPAAAIDLERAIAALPARRRMVLVLHDLEGWTHGEIGAALEIADGTSKSDPFHARRAIRAQLQSVAGGDR